jgi:Uma2 family endonuclease
MNLYYDVDHPLWHKRPDWFAVVGVPRLYEGRDMRLSYVVWQERVNPYVVVELLSPGTEKEDLGQTERAPGTPPTKWEVYEQILRVPYYVLFDRYTNNLRAFRLVGGITNRSTSPISASRFLSGILALGFGRGVMRVLSGCGCGGLMPKNG